MNNDESTCNINEFDSFLNNMNNDSYFDQINHAVDNNNISLNANFLEKVDAKDKSEGCEPMSIVYRITDFLMFLELLIVVIFDIIVISLFTFEFAISFYSVILMNYTFFVSSIISFAKAPIYKMLSRDVLNSVFSFIQVLLSSPLIAFYIYYIVKSVKNLGEFISDVPKFSKKVLSMITIKYNHYFMTYVSMIKNVNYKKIFSCEQFKEITLGFLAFVAVAAVTVVLGYVLFCIDKCVIVIGSICYLIHTIKIFVLMSPSYLYFFQIIFNIRCRKFKFVDLFFNFLDKIKNKIRKEILNEESNDEKETNKDSIQNNIDVSNDKKPIITNGNDFEVSDSNLYVSTDEESDSLTKNNFEVSNDKKSVSSTKNNFEVSNEQDDSEDEKQYIGELKTDSEQYKEIWSELFHIIGDLISKKNYIPLYDYSQSIAFDRHNHSFKRICIIIFLILNLAIIANDLYQLSQAYSDYLVSSIILRFLLIPFFSFFNIVTTFFRRAQDKSLRYIIYISYVSTVLIFIVVVFGHQYLKYYQSYYRINDLKYIPPFNNITAANKKMLIHPICSIDLFGVSAFEAFGYALGGYDIKRNITIFENQMKIFFGEKSSIISYKVYELDKYFLFLKYYDPSIDTHIFAFRGYNSGPELAFQFELFVSQYVVPFFEDVVPFYESINDFWLGFYTDFLNAFGLRFFENKNLIVRYVDKIRQIYNKENLKDNERVIFTGINIGGVIAKIVGTLEEHKSISFISFPLMDFLESLFHYPESYISYITHVFNVDGIFSHIDSDNANNIGINTPLFYQSKWCTSGFCDVFSRTDYIYRSFCTMSEICGKGNQFNYYCVHTISERNLEIIRESLQDEE